MPSNSTVSVVRAKLARYLAGKITLRAFCTWFVPYSWDIRARESPEACKLVFRIELLLAEYSSGHRTKQDFRDRLRNIVTSIPVTFADPMAKYSITRPVPRGISSWVKPFPSVQGTAVVNQLASRAADTRRSGVFA